MDSATYRELLDLPNASDEAIALFEFFEPYFDKYNDISHDDNKNRIESYFNEIRKRIESDEIKKKVTSLREKMRKYKFARPVFDSLSRNLSTFTKGQSRSIDDKASWRKLLCSSYSVTRLMVSIDDFNRAICNDSTLKPMLLLGVDDGHRYKNHIRKELRKRDISESVRSEIDEIIESSKTCHYYTAFPVLECTTTVFERLVSNIGFRIIHIAGHGASDAIVFDNSFMDKTQFENALVNQKLEFVLLNCCFSYEFVQQQCVNNSKVTLAHSGKLSNVHANAMSQFIYWAYLRTTSFEDASNDARLSVGGNYQVLTNP